MRAAAAEPGAVRCRMLGSQSRHCCIQRRGIASDPISFMEALYAVAPDSQWFGSSCGFEPSPHKPFWFRELTSFKTGEHRVSASHLVVGRKNDEFSIITKRVWGIKMCPNLLVVRKDSIKKKIDEMVERWLND